MKRLLDFFRRESKPKHRPHITIAQGSRGRWRWQAKQYNPQASRFELAAMSPVRGWETWNQAFDAAHRLFGQADYYVEQGGPC